MDEQPATPPDDAPTEATTGSTAAPTSPSPDEPIETRSPAAQPTPAQPTPAQPTSAPAGAWTAQSTSSSPRGVGSDRAPLVLGVILIVLGLAFLVGRYVTVELGFETWPLWIIVPGLAMLGGSLLIPDRGGVGLAIPGGIVTMVGVVLAFQEAYDAYETWAYAWALVAPGGVGLGMFVFGLFRGYDDIRDNGLRTMLVGLGLFLGFALFFEGVIGISGNRIANLDTILPIALVVLGIVVLVMAFVPRGRRAAQ